MAPALSFPPSPTPSQYPVSASRLRCRSQREDQEVQELIRIMDPGYLSPAGHNHTYPSRRKMEECYYVDEEGHIHDIDYRPFPPLPLHQRERPTRDRRVKWSDEGRSSRPSPRRSQTYPNSQVSSERAPYWETFTFPQYENIEDADPFGTLGRSYVPPCSTNSPTQQEVGFSSADVCTTHLVDGDTSDSSVQVGRGVGKRVLEKSKRLQVETRIPGGGTKMEPQPFSPKCEVSGRGKTLPMGPKQKLRRTWVATRFVMRLKVIRTQRWFKERSAA